MWRLLNIFRRRRKHNIEELALRLGVGSEELRAVTPAYTVFELPKRSGGTRRILAPDPALKAMQRRVLRRVLALLVAHRAATGFERGRSIVTHARAHVGRPVVLRMDIRGFFQSTRAERVEKFFQRIGWDREAAALLTLICTSEGSLPQGAPTSPRLANLVNYRMDARLTGLATAYGATYTRYADDLTFSFVVDDACRVRALAKFVRHIVESEGYRLNHRKQRILRRHQQQRITGLIVNDRVNLPRTMRRKLRAIEHQRSANRPVTLTDQQCRGWSALVHMIDTQRGDSR